MDAEGECPLIEVVANRGQLKPKEKNALNKKRIMADGLSMSKNIHLNQIIEFGDDESLCPIKEDDEYVKDQTENVCVQTPKTEMVTKGTNTLQINSYGTQNCTLHTPPICRTTFVDIIDDDVIEIFDSDEKVNPTKIKDICLAAPW
ncbi:hypothetical protein GQX74_000213 [Glossina fuscipes]|nr:hypothetical protein GQX74_000213 [Glossina fuscipes]